MPNGDDIREVWRFLQDMDNKLDKALLSGQDFKTWRDGHERVHAEQCPEHRKSVEKLADQVHKNREMITASLTWRSVLIALITGATAVVGPHLIHLVK